MNQPFWTLNKLLSLVLAGGFLALFVEIRAMHDNVLADHRIAWTPIVFSGFMVAAIAASIPFWERGGRRVLFWAFALAPLVGLTGFWFHNNGQPVKGVRQELAVWAPASKASSSDSDQGGGPPALAPLSFAGLGLIGLLACASRFQYQPAGQAGAGAG